jgi:hypothetical protein
MQAAIEAGVHEPNAMTVATCDPTTLQPSCRVVLLRQFSPEEGFVFFTNYHSRKGQELAANSRVALLLFWPQLERQIRIEGTARQAPVPASDAYWAQRPHGARIVCTYSFAFSTYLWISLPSRRNRASLWLTEPTWRDYSQRPTPAILQKRSLPDLPTGEAIACNHTRSSSGRADARACTIESYFGGARKGKPGPESGWRPSCDTKCWGQVDNPAWS